MTDNETPTLTRIQIIELERLEALIVENTERGEPLTTAVDKDGIRTLTINTDEPEPPAEREQIKRHIELHAELICYLAAEGLDYANFCGLRKDRSRFFYAFHACSILRSRREFFAEPESFGCQVLLKAGFRPPSDGVAQAR